MTETVGHLESPPEILPTPEQAAGRALPPKLHDSVSLDQDPVFSGPASGVQPPHFLYPCCNASPRHL